ncbi:MAG TPA: MmgE/PrpD family protein [Candidatus Acidoferrales bacterium]|nr:MmgE/PrpD family protein [Candidatus Acidoferrales bacterium]
MTRAEWLQNVPDKLTRKIAEFTVSFKLEAAPKAVLENAKLAILDCLGVAALATSQEIGAALLRFARENSPPGPCTVWGTRTTTTPRDAALLNGTLAHGLDYDDRNHSSTYTLATAIAAAEPLDLSGARVLGAFIVGREVRNALDGLFGKRSSGIGPGAKGWHSNGILGPIAAACTASNVLGLDVKQTVAAVGLAAGSCGALTRDGGTMAKPFRAGHAAATGLTCALLAKNGLSSDETALESRYGLLEALGPLPKDILEGLGKDLGSKFHLESDPRIKPYASCTATHSGVEAMLRLVRRNPIDPQAVDAIECDLKPYPLVRYRPERGFEGRFSMAFCLALALINGRINPDDFVDERVNDPLVQEIMRRTRHTPEAPALVVILKDGTRLEEKLAVASDLRGWNQVAKKFQRCLSAVAPDHLADKTIDLVRQLETVSSIRGLTAALKFGAAQG